MSQNQNQINLKEQSLVELKALSYDLQLVVQQYSQMLNTVNQEINGRLEAQNKVAQEKTLQASAPKAEAKSKKLAAVKD